VQDQVAILGEGDTMLAQQAQLADGAHRRDYLGAVARFDRFRGLPRQPEYYCTVTTVPVPGRAEGSEQLRVDPARVRQQVVGAQPGGEGPGGPHRAHRV